MERRKSVSGKAPYFPPVVTEFGDVRKLTKAINKATGRDDGANGTNKKTA